MREEDGRAAGTGPGSVFVATCDLAAQMRGRAVPASVQARALETGLGWVPANLALTGFGVIADDNVFGAGGDLRLLPDPASAIDLPSHGEVAATRIMLATLVELDGRPWPCCPRTFLQDALADLRDQHGLLVRASFEHEFTLSDAGGHPPFSWQAARAVEPFGSDLLELTAVAGLEPENWLPEYGPGQFEITLHATDGLAAADRAIVVRELVRDLARRHGRVASFAPLPDPAGVGNGVHVHLSLREESGRPVLRDPSRPGRLSVIGARFCAGILAHASALTAITAPSPVSALRLSPHRWSAAAAFLGERHREALLRIAPTVGFNGSDEAAAFNLEYRAADATANPWLVLGALVRAGMSGLAGTGEAHVHPQDISDATIAALPCLPDDLEAALQSLQRDPVASGWFAPDLLATFAAVKRAELALLEGLDTAARCRRVADVY